MKIINASVKLFPQVKNSDLIKRIELAGRTCYKSEDKINDDSAVKFVQGTIFKRGHESVVEHGGLAVRVDKDTYLAMYNIRAKYSIDRYETHIKFMNMTWSKENGYIISGNIRAWRDLYRRNDKSNFIIESLVYYLSCELDPLFQDLYRRDELDPLFQNLYRRDEFVLLISLNHKLLDVEDFASFNDEEQLAHIYRTCRIITNRGVTHEFVRNRDLSFSQESTRYVNYVTKDNNKGELKFIDIRKAISLNKKLDTLSTRAKAIGYEYWMESCVESECSYTKMIQEGFPPEIARDVLNNSLKTEMIMTTNMHGWNYFLKQRTASVAHPEAREISIPLLYQFKEENLLTHIEPDPNDVKILLGDVV